jgi:hypothetical protein
MLLMRMAQAPRIEDISYFVSGTQPQTSTPQRTIAKAEPQSTDHSISFHNDKSLTENWISFVEKSKKISPSVAAILEHAALSALDDHKVTLSVSAKEPFFHDQLKDPKQISKIKELIKKIWNFDAHISVETHEEETKAVSPRGVRVQKEKTQAQETREQVENHPAIQNIQKTFKGKIHNITDMKQ